MLSVVSSGFTILFLFWSITHLARKLVTPDTEYTNLVVIASGVIGALAYTFSDSFWFSAVEAEVYGMSSFFYSVRGVGHVEMGKISKILQMKTDG